MNLTTYLQAGYPGLAVITSEEARAETEIAAVCTGTQPPAPRMVIDRGPGGFG